MLDYQMVFPECHFLTMTIGVLWDSHGFTDSPNVILIISKSSSSLWVPCKTIPSHDSFMALASSHYSMLQLEDTPFGIPYRTSFRATVLRLF